MGKRELTQQSKQQSKNARKRRPSPSWATIGWTRCWQQTFHIESRGWEWLGHSMNTPALGCKEANCRAAHHRCTINRTSRIFTTEPSTRPDSERVLMGKTSLRKCASYSEQMYRMEACNKCSGEGRATGHLVPRRGIGWHAGCVLIEAPAPGH